MSGPKTAYPAAALARGPGAALLTNTASSVVSSLPRTATGLKPSFIRVSVATTSGQIGGVFFRLGAAADTSTTAITSDTLVTSNEAAWLQTGGLGAFAALGIAGATIVQVSACEEGGLIASTQSPAGTG